MKVMWIELLALAEYAHQRWLLTNDKWAAEMSDLLSELARLAHEKANDRGALVRFPRLLN